VVEVEEEDMVLTWEFQEHNIVVVAVEDLVDQVTVQLDQVQLVRAV
jgi:hypothetical protein